VPTIYHNSNISTYNVQNFKLEQPNIKTIRDPVNPRIIIDLTSEPDEPTTLQTIKPLERKIRIVRADNQRLRERQRLIQLRQELIELNEDHIILQFEILTNDS
jgi:AAA15 family ATPase/GTPase